MQRSQVKQMLDTRRLYKFETMFFKKHPLGKLQSIKKLKTIGHKILKEYKKSIPIKAGNGTFYNGRFLSYYHPDEGIVLARNERNIVTLLHEITHACGHDYHNRRFVDFYFKFLIKFGCNKKDLKSARIKFKLS